MLIFSLHSAVVVVVGVDIVVGADVVVVAVHAVARAPQLAVADCSHLPPSTVT